MYKEFSPQTIAPNNNFESGINIKYSIYIIITYMVD